MTTSGNSTTEFVPMNDAHAIVQCQILLQFSRSLDDEALAKLIGADADLDKAFPEKNDLQVVQFTPNALTFGKIGTEYKRTNNKTTLWSLQLTKENISITCSDYKRWDIIFAEMKTHLRIALSKLSVSDVSIKELILKVVDQFYGPKEGSAADGLIVPNEYIAHNALGHGNLWHSNSGWFERIKNANYMFLNNLNASAADAQREIPGAVASAGLTDVNLVTIDHTIFLRAPDSAILPDVSKIFGPEDALTEKILADMHALNKTVVASILGDSMRKKIGLVV